MTSPRKLAGLVFLATLAQVPLAAASPGSAHIGKTLPVLWVGLFAAMLLSIAILPLLSEKWWHPNRNKLLLSAVLGLPALVLFATLDLRVVLHTAQEYVSFIVLLTALFVISGGILIRTDRPATPVFNTSMLGLGAILASFMGTTGAAMLLIRPLLESNQERTRVVHTVLFFIFLVANIGGCLTPLGDPPLFMGYLKGVPFGWTLGLWKEWAATVALLLVVYFLLDSFLHAREPGEARQKDQTQVTPVRIQGGALNFPLLLGVLLSVAFLHNAPFPIRELILVALSYVSWRATPRAIREGNKFSFHPILEVAALFAGIFATMIPAIQILEARGAELGISSPMGFFWSAGTLSSFLDNAPTYVVFFSLAKAVGIPLGGAQVASTGVDAQNLVGISLGAVFMGAMTYIGNAPNFMVKSIAEERKLAMPSFFGYMLWTVGILLPIFALVSWIFLR